VKGFNALSDKILAGQANRLAKGIDKEGFMYQLQDAWSKHIKKNCNIDEEVEKARYRIDNSGPFKKTFKTLGLTDDDLRTVIQNIIDEKPLPYKAAEKPPRNGPCTCGSGKKYKKCCGKS